MAKVFNTTAVCIPDEHYMVNLDRRLEEIKKMVDGEKVFYDQPRQTIWENYYDTCTSKILKKGLLCCLYGFSDIWKCRI